VLFSPGEIARPGRRPRQVRRDRLFVRSSSRCHTRIAFSAKDSFCRPRKRRGGVRSGALPEMQVARRSWCIVHPHPPLRNAWALRGASGTGFPAVAAWRISAYGTRSDAGRREPPLRNGPAPYLQPFCERHVPIVRVDCPHRSGLPSEASRLYITSTLLALPRSLFAPNLPEKGGGVAGEENTLSRVLHMLRVGQVTSQP
jgi:hypothetical protein